LRVGVEGQRLKDEFLYDIDRDTEAFNEVMAAIKLPKKTDAEKAARGAAMEAANKGASTATPRSTSISGTSSYARSCSSSMP